MKKSIPVGVSAPDTGLPDTTKKLNNPSPKKDLHHLVRMLFSCLVDADFLDTEKFMSLKRLLKGVVIQAYMSWQAGLMTIFRH